ncbi:Uncharacterised protein [Vibrio cholerae]|nr:Uncharacterised protein [Vibrio cholerae]
MSLGGVQRVGGHIQRSAYWLTRAPADRFD